MVQISCARQSMVLGLAVVSWLVSCSSPPWGWAADDLQPVSTLRQLTASERRVELEQRLDQLIQQLGSPHYATREKAQTELEQLGLEAFDALNHAQYDDDIEIALRARYLVRGMQVNWSRDSDPAEVKLLLSDYGGKPEEERRKLIQQLASLNDQQGMAALCRLVRYEASPKLSKHAALLLMEMKPPAQSEGRERMAAAIRAGVGLSQRPAAAWLLGYALLLSGESGALERCQEIVNQEQETLAKFSNQTSSEITRDLLRWFADQLRQQSQEDQAQAAMRKTLDFVDGSRQQVLDAVDWLRNREGWDVVMDAARRFPNAFQRDPLLIYRLAEAESKVGREEQAAETAKRALAMADSEPEKHLEIAANLQHDGLFQWAESEYRHVIVQYPDNPTEEMRARLLLSEMLHETGDDLAASQLLRELLESIESDEQVRMFVEEVLGRDESGVRSRMLFFQSLHHAEQKERDQQRDCLRRGYENYPLDADVLIAMYRLPDADETWRQETLDRINRAIADFRQQIVDFTKQATSSQSFEERALAAYQLASAHNQLAWLVSNTEGDFDEAVQSSKRSLELRPNAAGFLDTLGRCYYAKGDLANAIKYQSKAAALEPHSPPILAQLELFKESQAALQEKEQDGSNDR